MVKLYGLFQNYNCRIAVLLRLPENIIRTAWRFGFFFLLLQPYISDPHVYNKQESEVNMPEYEHNREERIDTVINEILSSKENAIRFMQEAGLYDADGHLAPMYR